MTNPEAGKVLAAEEATFDDLWAAENSDQPQVAGDEGNQLQPAGQAAGEQPEEVICTLGGIFREIFAF